MGPCDNFFEDGMPAGVRSLGRPMGALHREPKAGERENAGNGVWKRMSERTLANLLLRPARPKNQSERCEIWLCHGAGLFFLRIPTQFGQ
jgi:hypothetical protein